MRFIKFAVVTVAFIALVSAKIGFGSCPETIPMKAWVNNLTGRGYSTDFDLSQPYNHEFIAIDKQFDQLLEMASKFGLKLPLNIGCDDFGTVPPYNKIAKAIYDAAQAQDSGQRYANGKNFNYPTQEVFELFFPPRNDAVVKLVDYSPIIDQEKEYYYICVDSFSFPAVLAQVRSMGIPIPPEAIQVIDIVNQLSVILKKLNLTLKIEGAVLVGARVTSASDFTRVENKYGKKIPNYAWSDLKIIDKAACPAL